MDRSYRARELVRLYRSTMYYRAFKGVANDAKRLTASDDHEENKVDAIDYHEENKVDAIDYGTACLFAWATEVDDAT